MILMRIVAIETSEPVGSLAALQGDEVLIERQLPPQQGTAAAFAPALKETLQLLGWGAMQIQGVAVTIGPGSFTGLRVGVTAAKTLAYAAQAAVVGIETFEAIAAGCPAEVAQVAVAIDGQRGQVVCQTFRRGSDDEMTAVGPWQLIARDAWLAGLTAGIAVAGSALRGWQQDLPPGVQCLDPQYWRPTAATIGRLAARRFARGESDNLWSLVPRYHRRSAAEERWDRRRQNERSG